VHTRKLVVADQCELKRQGNRLRSETAKAMAAQELLLFDAGECLLEESSRTSLFDCLDCETGVEDLLSDGRHPNQVSSPVSSHLMSTLTVSLAACSL